MELLEKTAARMAEGAEAKMRQVVRDMRDELDAIDLHLDSWGKAVDEGKAPELTQLHVVERFLGLLSEVEHMPTGGTRHMHYRHARRALLEMLAEGAGE